MGLSPTNLGPADTNLIKRFGPEIVTLLRRIGDPNSAIAAECLTWFGRNDQAMLDWARRKCRRMASLINLKEIKVHGTRIGQRNVNGGAAAFQPAGGWRNNTANTTNAAGRVTRGFVSHAQGQGFHFQLNTGFNGCPTYKVDPDPANGVQGNRRSKFKIVVHEVTHLLIDTDDHQYGEANCLALAINNRAQARANADNWGMFIEALR